MFYKGMNVVIDDSPMHTALEYAWRELEHHPFDGGKVEVEFDTVHRPDDTTLYPNEWQGISRARTEEGHRVVRVHVHDMRDSDVWCVDVHTESADCDGRYSGGCSVFFELGQLPKRESDYQRDHSAEAAGY